MADAFYRAASGSESQGGGTFAGLRCATRLEGEITRDEASAWDRFVESVEEGDVAQLLAWSRVRSAAGFSAMHMTVASNDRLVAGAQVLTRGFPVLGSIGYVPYGPVVAEGMSDRSAVCLAVARGLTTLMRDGNIRVLFVQPPPGAADVSAALADVGFRSSDAGITPSATLRIDLAASEDELRTRLNKRLRTWTQRWPERGVTVRLGNEEDLPLLADLLAQSAEYQDFEPMTLDYLQQMYDALAPAGNAVLFVGEVREKPVAVDLFTVCGGVIRDRFIGLNRDSETSNLSVPGAIKWNAMLWAKQNGLRWFDFGGVALDVAQTMVSGHKVDQQMARGGDRFKLSFGGAPCVLPPAMEIARPKQLLSAYHAVEGSERGREVISNVRRRLRGGKA